MYISSTSSYSSFEARVFELEHHLPLRIMADDEEAYNLNNRAGHELTNTFASPWLGTVMNTTFVN